MRENYVFVSTEFKFEPINSVVSHIHMKIGIIFTTWLSVRSRFSSTIKMITDVQVKKLTDLAVLPVRGSVHAAGNSHGSIFTFATRFK